MKWRKFSFKWLDSPEKWKSPAAKNRMIAFVKRICLKLRAGSRAGILRRIDVGGVGHVELRACRERAAAGRKAKAAQLLVGNDKGAAAYIGRGRRRAAQAVKIADQDRRRRAARF